jgi:tryptophan halogenase
MGSDFIVLHYHVTDRDDSAFWRYCKNMQVPEMLARRIQMFRDRAHTWVRDGELFRLDSWTQVMLGQRIRPRDYSHMPMAMSEADLGKLLDNIRSAIQGALAQMPSHQEFLERYCKANDDIWAAAMAK